MDDIETTQADTSLPATDNEVPAAVEEAFNLVFSGPQGREQEEAEELEQEGVVTPDGNDPAEEASITGEQAAGTETAEAAAPETTEQPERDDAQTASEGKTLDPFLRFVGMNSGLTNEGIDKLYATDPALAETTLTSLASSFDQLSRQFLGTAAPPVAPVTQAPETTAAQSPTPGLDAFMAKLAAFTEANGEDLGQFAKLVNEEIVSPMKALRAEIAVQQQNAVREEAVSAFESVRGTFEDFYGKKDGQLSDGQRQARATVARIADQMRAGAKAQGTVVSIKDAIARAHAVVTHGMQQKAAQQAVVAQVQKRAKSATQPPTQRKTRPTGERSDAAATSAASQKMTEMGWDQF